ncbi:MAG: 30S ribosomal protein S6 [Rhodospirillales bacterium CG15_BIG_FIL_POST_REV_8_21_14_020_66_15]|nr:MAG: 30S ribosomal protein S6 [Rhodospirillales bacterium CG15_BIG_FIL_POST_REV_8_21_14_020_66_15]
MPYYESVFIARPDISSAQVDGLVELFEKAISSGGGSIQKKEYWGLRNLAYRIKKNRKGHYMLMNIDAPAAAVAEMERQMRINEDVMRHLTLRVEELEEGPSVIVQNKDRGDERPRRGPRPDRGDRGPRHDSGDDRGRNGGQGDNE